MSAIASIYQSLNLVSNPAGQPGYERDGFAPIKVGSRCALLLTLI
jgi:hypothetical protein